MVIEPTYIQYTYMSICKEYQNARYADTYILYKACYTVAIHKTDSMIYLESIDIYHVLLFVLRQSLVITRVS